MEDTVHFKCSTFYKEWWQQKKCYNQESPKFAKKAKNIWTALGKWQGKKILGFVEE